MVGLGAGTAGVSQPRATTHGDGGVDGWPLFGSGDRADAFSVLIYGVEQSAEKRTGRCWGKCGPQLESAACSPGRCERRSWEPCGALRNAGWPGSLPRRLPRRPPSPPASRRSLRHPRGALAGGEGFGGVLTAQVLLSARCPVTSAPFFLEGKSWWDWKCQRVKAGSVCQLGGGQPPGTGRLCS